MIRKFLECGADYMVYINITDMEIDWYCRIRFMNSPPNSKDDILTYKLCVLYKEMIETHEKAVKVVQQKFINMYSQRCGGISIDMLS